MEITKKINDIRKCVEAGESLGMMLVPFLFYCFSHLSLSY